MDSQSRRFIGSLPHLEGVGLTLSCIEGNRGHTYLGDPENMKQIYPDYITMAKAFNVPAERVMFKKDLRDAMKHMLDSDQPYVLDVITPYTEHVLPFIPAGKTVREMIYQE